MYVCVKVTLETHKVISLEKEKNNQKPTKTHIDLSKKGCSRSEQGFESLSRPQC